MLHYLFGFKDNKGLNHILIELKKELFYNWDVNVEVDAFCERFLVKIIKLMVKEKHIMLGKNCLINTPRNGFNLEKFMTFLVLTVR